MRWGIFRWRSDYQVWEYVGGSYKSQKEAKKAAFDYRRKHKLPSRLVCVGETCWLPYHNPEENHAALPR